MANRNPLTRRPMEKPATMSERLSMMIDLLQEARAGQEKANSLLADLRVDVAAVQRANETQGQHIADMRAEVRADVRQLSDRLRDAELQMQRIPMNETAIGRAHKRLDEHEQRLRELEGDGREGKVVSRSILGWGAELRRYMVGAVGGLVLAAAIWAAKNAG